MTTIILEFLLYIRGMLRFYLFLTLILTGFLSFSQGNKNLYKQYRTGPDPDGFYHLWNYSLYGRLNWMNSDQDYTKNRMGKGVGFVVQKLESKTFGFSTGFEFNEIRYQYDGFLENSSDSINWLSFPLSIRLYPSRKLLFEVGVKYHYFLNAKNSTINNLITGSLKYPNDSFGNTFGTFITIQYQIWKRLNIGFQYQYMKGESINSSGIQPSVFDGLTLTLSAFIKNPMKRPELN